MEEERRERERERERAREREREGIGKMEMSFRFWLGVSNKQRAPMPLTMIYTDSKNVFYVENRKTYNISSFHFLDTWMLLPNDFLRWRHERSYTHMCRDK